MGCGLERLEEHLARKISRRKSRCAKPSFSVVDSVLRRPRVSWTTFTRAGPALTTPARRLTAEDATLKTLTIHTASGSTYQLFTDSDDTLLKRQNKDRQLRRDGTAVRVLSYDLAVGRPAQFVLEPLSPNAEFTVRWTSEVTRIDEDSE